MKICVYGAGAVGGHLAGRLAASGVDVSLVARGEQLAAIQQQGLLVQTQDGDLHSHPKATDRPDELGPQDAVIVAVKAPALPAIAESLGALLHDDSLVLFVVNGIPWWYFTGHAGPLDGMRLHRLDPNGSLQRSVTPEQIVGAVAYTAGSVVAPGVIRAENARNRLVLGRPDGSTDSRLEALSSLLERANLEVTLTPKIRDAVWAKLTMNMIGGSLGVLSASPMKDVLNAPAVAAAAGSMAAEAAATARALGCDPGDPQEGLTRLAKSDHLQSIAQDMLAGRTMEVDAMFRVPRDLAALVQVPTPYLDLMTELATQRARVAGSYSDVAG